MDLLDLFDRTYVLNLPERTDRRAQTEQELRRHFSAEAVDRVRFYPAIKPEDKGPFTSLGSYGCFLSVVDILRTAEADSLGSVLILQDDVRFRMPYRKHGPHLLAQLEQRGWDYVQLGYIDWRGEVKRRGAPEPSLVDFDGEVTGAHCVGFHARIIRAMLDHLEAILVGRPGDRILGPMPVDGAFNTFKWRQPEAVRLLPVPNLVEQRRSRSDITPKKLDRSAALRPLLHFARTAAERLRP